MILIDTGPLVALCDASDSFHETALKDFDRLARHELGVCDAVLTEACFHLPHSFQRRRLQSLVERSGMVMLPPAPDLVFWNDVFVWLENYSEHEPDWADGCIAVLAGRNSKVKVWTYDREFQTIWRKPNGKPITMAR